MGYVIKPLRASVRDTPPTRSLLDVRMQSSTSTTTTMAKRLRHRLARVLPSFHAFRAKGPAAAAASSPVVSDAGLDVDYDLGFPAHPGRAQAALVSGACCRPSRRRSAPADFSPLLTETPAYLWRKEEKWWHVVACSDADADGEGEGEGEGGGESELLSTPRRKIDSDDGIFPPMALRRGRRRKLASRRRSSQRRLPRERSKYSSADDDDSGWFSSDEDAETTLMSTTEVESSDNNLLRRRQRRRRRKRKGVDWCGRITRSGKSTAPEGWAAVGRLMPCAAPAVRESFAVVKLSEDPKEDFQRSMAEMVMEKEIFDAQGLEQLLRCFLSLNSRRHHAAIVAAFRDIWRVLFTAAADASPGSAIR